MYELYGKMIEKYYGYAELYRIYALIGKKFSAMRTNSNTWKFILFEGINLNASHLGLNSLFEWLCCIFHS